MQKLANIGQKEIMQGFLPDIPSSTTPVWEEGANVVFLNGAVQPFPGMRLKYELPAGQEILAMLSGEFNNEISLVIATKTSLFVYEGGVMKEAAKGFNATYWSLGKWGNWILATNGKDLPKIIRAGGVQDFTPLLDTTTRLKKVRFFLQFKNFIFGIGVNDEEAAYWCDSDDIDNWQVGDSSLAGSLYPRGLDSNIVAGKVLGNEIYLFSADKVVRIKYTGLPYVFGMPDQALDEGGALSINSVVEAQAKMFVFSAKGIYETNGYDIEYIDNAAVRKFIQEDLKEKLPVCAAHIPLINHIVFFYPSGSSSNNSALGYNYTDKIWTIWERGFNAVDSRTLNFSTLFAKGNLIYAIDTHDLLPIKVNSLASNAGDMDLRSYTGHGQNGCGEGGLGGTTFIEEV